VNRKIVSLGVLFLLSLFSGCTGTDQITNLVTINYHQQGNFNRWNLFNTQSGQITDGMYMRYRITSISNRDSSPSLFHFDPNKLSSTSHDEKPVAFPLLSGALPFDISPGQLWTTALGITIEVKGDPASLRTQPVFLKYESDPGEHVVMFNDTSKATTVPYIDPLTNPAQIH